MSIGDRRGGADSATDHEELRVGHLLATLGGTARRGGAMLFLAQAVKVVVQFGAVILLARLLPPEAFGLVAMVVALGMALDVARDCGLSAVTIQKSDLAHDLVSTLFWINVLLGVVLGLGLFLTAPLLAAFYDQPALVEVTRWLSLSFVLSGFATQHCALLRRQMRFAPVAAMEAGGEIAALAIALALALAGAGLWALVAQRLTPPALALAMSWWLCRWRPAWPGWAPGTGDSLKFGLSVAGTNLIAALARSVDQMLVGWMWGASALGLYERAAKLLMVPINNINLPLYSVALPALSRLSDQGAIFRHAYCGILEKLALVTVPAGVLAALTSDWIVALLFGARWADAAPLVACFGLAAACQPIMMTFGLLYVPLNRPHELLRATMVDGGLTVLSVVAGLWFGVLGVAAALVLIGIGVRLPAAVWLATRAGPVHQRDIYSALVVPATASVVVAAAAVAARHFAFGDRSPPSAIVGLVCVSAVALVAGGSAAWILHKMRPRTVSP